MIKAIFFDIDGTLVSHTISDIPEGVLDAFAKMQQNGLRLFLATGRHIKEFENLPLHGYPFDGYVTQTGQICYDRDFKPIYEEPFTDSDTARLVDLFNEKKIPIVLLNIDSLYINFVDETVIRVQNAINTPIPQIGRYHGEKLFGATVFGSDEQTGYVASLLPDCKESSWHSSASDIVLKQAGKVNGIRKILEYCGIDQSETMAFCDGDNDLDMIQFAEIGIAMGNATDLIKRNSDYITTSVDEDGILNALAHFNLI
ncbi:MAG: Cof-type HAD-IIB family hydrolase [Erysipelotrichaceae bacterium]|nr:Cof-type HAD-IIB family hydrolase [Erysipelotrichaceae bacterium]